MRSAVLLFAALQLLSFAFKQNESGRREQIQEFAIKVVVYGFMWSWCAVIQESGTIPPRRKGQIFVCNHSTVIDVALLMKNQPFSLTGQSYDSGFIGFMQKFVIRAPSLGVCIRGTRPGLGTTAQYAWLRRLA